MLDNFFLVIYNVGNVQFLNVTKNTINNTYYKLHFGTISLAVFSYTDLYVDTGEVLGEGSFGLVKTFRHVTSKKDFAVKVKFLYPL